MLKFNCCLCDEELEEPGALAFSPPGCGMTTLPNVVDKFHICRPCWRDKFRPTLMGQQKLVPTVFKDLEPPTEEEIAEGLRNIERILGPEENTFDVVEHTHSSPHSCREVKHIHAWGSVPHSHLLRQICGRPECKGFATHDIHTGDDVKAKLDAAIDQVSVRGDGTVLFGDYTDEQLRRQAGRRAP